MPTVVVATGNPGKLQEMKAYLGELDWTLKLKPAEIDVEETGETFLENARLKASQVAIALDQWAIADDSGLEVRALNGAPGLYSARYGSSDGDRIERLLRELGDATDRQAQFVCAIALAQPDGQIILETAGVCLGTILTTPRGSGGFGYDPVFYVPALAKTFAEMPPAQKEQHSHRGIAFAQIMPQLRSLSLT
ncbi:MAG: RdgB/HAM1 family non-canonical purine NTP pyrophosphatase [Leptolyngbyaceae cyanobacterium SM1_1_3]|nr:RdgB/HAM1 family non-canonical purine NTP pyrophosphatase [Leptolyngbyaceae cyanobacterium SM1_1_3]NJN04777.1 RdgB/HAM1 family non-canonical purine NTP pyrophosphatase [Leptolyngbyaceae cyanobacterium RM1_1_2]NJO11884.1 RdgB/HAM1 family non-canonical purine NTP pyrophosphatase [Leptolyngbyaceae cyanobacterium SL_1_1]